VRRELLDLGPSQWPGHFAWVVALVAGSGENQQPATGRDQLGDVGEGGVSRPSGQNLKREDLNDKIEGSVPGTWRRKQVGSDVLDRGLGEAPPGGGDRRP